MADIQYRFFVEGLPKAQPRARRARNGGVYTPKTIKPWKQAIATQALPHRPAELLSGPLRVDLVFRFERPKSHFRAGRLPHTLKPQHASPFHAQKPDKDNLEKAVLDALTTDLPKVRTAWWHDDAQVCDGRVRKYWCRGGEAPGVEITITPLEVQE